MEHDDIKIQPEKNMWLEKSICSGNKKTFNLK